MRSLVSVLVWALLACSHCFADEEHLFTFDNDLEGLTVHRGIWRWSDRAGMTWKVPEGSDGFAVYDVPGQGDELYSEFVPVKFGVNYTITYFLASEWPSSTTLALHLLSRGGEYLETIVNFVDQSKPDNTEWFTSTGYIPPGPDAVFSVFCQSGHQNPDEVTGYLWGCAIDSMTLITGPDTDVTTTTERTTTTPTTTTPTTTTPTTTTPTTTTPTTTTPTTTTPTTTTPTTTTPTTTTPTTTTPTTTTPTTTTPTTTPIPETIIDFDFDNNTAGWVLGRSNEAGWQRLRNPYPQSGVGDNVLSVSPIGIHAGMVMAISPQMIVGDKGEIKVGLQYHSKGTQKYPSRIRVRRSTSYTTFDAAPVVVLDTTQLTQGWQQTEVLLQGLTHGEVFNIVIEGSLGIHNQQNELHVSHVRVTGADLYLDTVSTDFDFENGIFGWSMGSVAGGRLMNYKYSDLDPSSNIPQPPSGQMFLVADRYDIHSGVMSIETPPIAFVAGTTTLIDLTFVARGSETYPASLRVRRKLMDGVYDALPFLDLTPYGRSGTSGWQRLSNPFLIPMYDIVGDTNFQLVFEVDVGASEENSVAVDNVSVITRASV